jgi:heat shock protein HslJ
MRLIHAAATFALTLSACTTVAANGTVPAEYLAIEWRLTSLDGQPFPAGATIDLSEPGRISGQGPCNRFFASYDGPLPDFRPGAIGATRMACPDLGAEAALFAALSAMTRAEVTGPVTLTLTGPEGRRMEFTRPVN